MTGDLASSVIAALWRHAPDFTGDITDATPLTDNGLCLDSLALMNVIADIEATFGISVSEVDISPENFGTAGLLVRFIAARARHH